MAAFLAGSVTSRKRGCLVYTEHLKGNSLFLHDMSVQLPDCSFISFLSGQLVHVPPAHGELRPSDKHGAGVTVTLMQKMEELERNVSLIYPFLCLMHKDVNNVN